MLDPTTPAPRAPSTVPRPTPVPQRRPNLGAAFSFLSFLKKPVAAASAPLSLSFESLGALSLDGSAALAVDDGLFSAELDVDGDGVAGVGRDGGGRDGTAGLLAAALWVSGF